MNDAFSPAAAESQTSRASSSGWGPMPPGYRPEGAAASMPSGDALRSVEDVATIIAIPPDGPQGDTFIDQSSEPMRRRIVLPILLFLASCASTYWVGTTSFVTLKLKSEAAVAGEKAVVEAEEAKLKTDSESAKVESPPLDAQAIQQANKEHREAMDAIRQQAIEEYLVRAQTKNGLVYMTAVMGILLAHELGHFLQAVRHRIPASLPFFIPMPINLFGTMGAVIGMGSNKANRRQLFDIGVTGPITGLIVAIPVTWAGIQMADHASRDDSRTLVQGVFTTPPWIAHAIAHHLHPEMPEDHEIIPNPLYLAGWMGMLITGLNMLPLSQLDGGHVVYTLFGPRRARAIARAFVVFAILYIISEMAVMWVTMLTLILILGIDHPPSADDNIELTRFQRLVAYASLAIPFACFPLGGVHFSAM